MTKTEKFTLISIAVLSIVILSLIPDNPKSKEWLSQASPVPWSELKHNPNEKIELNWLGIAAYPGADKDNLTVQYLNEHFQLELKPIFMDWNSYGQRRPLLLAGGDIPDVMWDGGPLGVRRNINNGFIMEVPYEVILREAPTYVKYLNRYGKEAWLYAHYKGKNFGLPTFISDPGRPRIGCWNLDYLKKVGIKKVPETLMEMEEALRRLRFDDPDGNGKKDTYGWYPNISHWSMSYIEVFCHFNTLPFEFVEKNGSMTWGGIEPEAKRALAVLNRWYKGELIDPDHILSVSNSNQSETKFKNGKTGYVYPVDGYASYDVSQKNSMASQVKELIGCEIAPTRPLLNVDGVPMGRTWGGAAHVLQLGKQLEQTPQKVLRFLHMMEQISKDTDTYLNVSTGREGVDWDIGPKGYRIIGPALEDPNYCRINMMNESAPLTNNFFFPSNLNLRSEDLTPKAKLDFDETYCNAEWSMRNPIGKSDVVPSASKYLEDLRRYQTIAFVDFITGAKPLDEFDDFVAEWKQRGGEVLLREGREVYSELQNIYQRVGAK